MLMGKTRLLNEFLVVPRGPSSGRPAPNHEPYNRVVLRPFTKCQTMEITAMIRMM